MRSLSWILALASLLGPAAAAASGGDEPAAQAELSRGEQVFVERCAVCHGTKASGTDKGPPLVHRIYHPSHHADLSFRWAMERGVRAHHWKFGDMPKTDGIGGRDAELVIMYIRHLQKEAGIY